MSEEHLPRGSPEAPPDLIRLIYEVHAENQLRRVEILRAVEDRLREYHGTGRTAAALRFIRDERAALLDERVHLKSQKRREMLRIVGSTPLTVAVTLVVRALLHKIGLPI